MANPKTTALTREAAWKAKQMYEERDARGRRLWTIQMIADFLGVGETTAYRAIKSVGPYQTLPEVRSEAKMDADAQASLERLLSNLRPEEIQQVPDFTGGSGLARLQKEASKTGDGMLSELQREGDEDGSTERPASSSTSGTD